MTSAGPWSVKGIDPKAREIAKDLARRSGMTLGEWLNQMIIDGGDLEPPPPPPFEGRSEAFRRPFPSAPPRAPAYYDEPETSDLTRITRALDALSARLEQAEHRSTLAISGIDQSVMGVLARMDGVERERGAAVAEMQDAVYEVRETQSRLAERLRRMDQEDGPRVEAMKALEASLARVAAQIYEGESRARSGLAEVREDVSGLTRRIEQVDAKVDRKADAPEVVEAVASRLAERLEAAEGRTSAAVRALEASFAGLDARLKAAETQLDPEARGEAERRFERLAAELSQKVEASRAEMAERLREAAGGRIEGMEAALRGLSAQVETAERQSAQAIESMGREVMRVAQTLNQRVGAVETRSAAAVEHLGGEMARIADAVEGRMRGVEAHQAEALERLGGEISRIAERLAERIATSERRAAQAIEDVGDQVARVSETIAERNDRAAGEIGERIRQSEERTAKLLQDTQEKLDRRLLEVQRHVVVEAAVAEAEAVQAETAPAAETETTSVGFEAEDDFEADAARAAFLDDPFAAIAGQEDFPDETATETELETAAETPAPSVEPRSEAAPGFNPARFSAAAFEDEDFSVVPEAAEAEPAPTTRAVATEPEAELPQAAAEPAAERPEFAPAARSSTRELIEAARAAARASSQETRGRFSSSEEPASGPAPAEDTARRGLSGLWPTKRKKKDHGSTVRTALLASGTAAALVATTVGSYLLYSKDEPTEVAEAAPAPAAAPASAAVQETAAADILAPALTGPTEAAPADAPAKRPTQTIRNMSVTVAPIGIPSAEQLFEGSVRQLASGDNTGVAALRRAADMGHTSAQFYLAKLLESGDHGVAKNPAEARRWTERAAIGGDAKAMHNLGLYYFDGTGGPKNATVAASWFRRAAEAGLQDSQFNLARLYEQGYGVQQNPAEAYRWYLIAAAAGDVESRSSAERLKSHLSPDAQIAAQRSAAAFHAQTTRTAER